MRQTIGNKLLHYGFPDDTYSKDDNLKIGKFTLTNVVEAVNLVPDSNTADPSNATMPHVEVPVVEAVEKIEKPAEKMPEIRPDPPFMAEPQAPDFVADPGNPPPYAESAGNAPEPPAMNDIEKGLIAALRQNTLPQRTAQGVERQASFTTTVERTVSNRITVTFYNHDGSVLERRKMDYGDRITFAAAPPRPSDAQYHYSFVAWVTRPDNTAPEAVATQDLSLYPLYSSTLREYVVTWVLNGEARTETLPYGAQPTCPFVTAKEPTADRVFIFSGWDKEITTVKEDTIYTATMTETPRLYTVTWLINGREERIEVPYGTTPVYEGSTDRAPDA